MPFKIEFEVPNQHLIKLKRNNNKHYELGLNCKYHMVNLYVRENMHEGYFRSSNIKHIIVVERILKHHCIKYTTSHIRSLNNEDRIYRL